MRNYIPIMLILLTLPIFSLAYQLEGRISDAQDGDPLVGVNIVIEGTELGAATDQDGEFFIRRVEKAAISVDISHIGYHRIVKDVTFDRPNKWVEIHLEPRNLTAPQVIVEPTRAIERQTPVTFSELSEQELEYRDQVQDIPFMLSDLPSTKTYSETGTGIGYSYLNIRGFDQRRISVLINGVPQNDPEDHNVYWIDFYDLVGSLKDIQVQRGAGAAFYGPAAIGGSVNLITQNYSRDPGIRLESLVGSYNTRKLSVEGSTGLLGDHWIGYGRFTRVTTDNYREWSWMKFWRYFAGLGYFSKSHILKLQTYGGPQEDGLAYYGVPKHYIKNRDLRTINPSSQSRDQEWFNQPHYELLHQWQLSENLSMNNTLYLIKGYGYFDYDGSWAPPSYYRLPVEELAPESWNQSLGGVNVASNTMIRAFVDNTQGGFLHKYTWDHERGTLSAGVSLRGHQSLHWGRIQDSDGLVFDDTVNQMTYSIDLGQEFVGEEGNKYYRYRGGKSIFSLFAHESYALQEDITLLLDLQVTRKQYRFWDEKYMGHEFDILYLFLNPRIGVNVNFTDRWNGYFNISRTTREPRLKNYYDAAEASQPTVWGAVEPRFQVTNGTYNYDEPLVYPETLYDFELGTGYRTTRLQFKANFYYMDFLNEIVKNGQLDRFGQPVTGNADRTRHYGVELSGTWELWRNLQVSGNATVSKNEFLQFTSFGWDEEENLDGNTIAGFPGVMGNVRTRYIRDPLFVTLSGKYMGKQYTTNFGDEGPAVEPYQVWDSMIGYRLHPGEIEMKVTLTINNIFDNLYAAHGEGTNFFPGATRRFFLGLEFEL